MESRTAVALMAFSGICVISGITLMSPSAAFSAMALAVLCALLPLMFSRRWMRLAALTLVVISVTLAVFMYPDFRKDQELYRERAKKAAAVQTNPAHHTTAAETRK
jgi:membrane protein implicated in regulation of membrane protease activity